MTWCKCNQALPVSGWREALRVVELKQADQPWSCLDGGAPWVHRTTELAGSFLGIRRGLRRGSSTDF